MDIFTLLIILFILFPIIEAIFQRMGGRRGGEEEPGELPGEERRPPARPPERQPRSGPPRRRQQPRPPEPSAGGRWWEAEAGQEDSLGAAETSSPEGDVREWGPAADSGWRGTSEADLEAAPEEWERWRGMPDAQERGPGQVPPDDLWVVLTGQRPPSRPPRPERAPEPRPAAAPEPGPTDPHREWELAGEEPTAVDIATSEAVSMQGGEVGAEPSPWDVRRRREVTGVPLVFAQRRSARDRLRLTGRDELRRAVVLAEVLGPPRSLKGPDWSDRS